MPNLVLHQLNDKPVHLRSHDQYINATQLCKAAGKAWGSYRRNQETEEFLQDLSRSISIPQDDLVRQVITGLNDLRGTWIHPRVAEHCKEWLGRRKRARITFLYILRHGKSDFVKIGIAHNVQRRIEQLQSANPIPLSFVGLWESSDALTLEKKLHTRYAQSLVHGEWFLLSQNAQIDIIDTLDRSATRVSQHRTIAVAYEQGTRQLSFLPRESSGRYPKRGEKA